MMTTKTENVPIWELPIHDVRYTLQYVLFDICSDNIAPYVDEFDRQCKYLRIRRANYYYLSIYLESTENQTRLTGKYSDRWPTLEHVLMAIIELVMHQPGARIDGSGNFWIKGFEPMTEAMTEYLKAAPPLIRLPIH